jgi:hypothetical protein
LFEKEVRGAAGTGALLRWLVACCRALLWSKDTFIDLVDVTAVKKAWFSELGILRTLTCKVRYNGSQFAG